MLIDLFYSHININWSVQLKMPFLLFQFQRQYNYFRMTRHFEIDVLTSSIKWRLHKGFGVGGFVFTFYFFTKFVPFVCSICNGKKEL